MRFGHRTVLRGLEFAASPGEFVAVVGPNGAGKTTFLRILATLLRPTEGMVRLAGFDLPSRSGEVRRRIGYVSHQPMLYGDLSAAQNLRFYCSLYGLSSPEARVDEVMELVGLAKRSRDQVRTCPHGMQQRLAIARAVLHEPQILLLDEPHTGLDQDACAMLDDVLRRVSAAGKTVVMATHDLFRAAEIASRVDVLSRGVIVASTPAARLSSAGLLPFYRDAVTSREIY